MLLLLLLLSASIAGYWWVTDPVRVRGMAESYLTDLLGGPVRVGEASLSIFEGLKLSHVSVKVDASDSPDALLFVADALDVQYDPGSLLRGRLEATRIIVTGPHVHLVEDVDGGRWNYQRLARGAERTTGTQPSGEGPGLPLPEVVLRNAKVDYSEIRAGVYASRGTMAIEGRLSPSIDGSHYSFDLQSRGAVEGVGPVVSGRLRLNDGRVAASLTNFRFGRDIEAMLPSEVRDWWLAHQLEGAMNIPDFRYMPATRGRRSSFHVQTQLDRVKLIVRPQELAGSEVARRLDRKAEGFIAMRNAGMNLTGQVNQLEAISMPPPIAVENVSGLFDFDDEGIRFSKVSGTVDGNPLIISGKIDGYTPDATAHLRIESPAGKPVHIPKDLRYAASLPDEAREIYDLLRPNGFATLWVEVDRKELGGRPQVSGELNVIDAACTCKYFPYPVRGASGTIAFGREADSGFERMEIQNVRGRGALGGPNENTMVTISGWVGPFDNTVGCNLRIEAENVNSEPALYAAFPQEVQDALAMFAEKGTGEGASVRGQGSAQSKSQGVDALRALTSFPRFHGNFVCDVIMPIGPQTTPTVSTDIVFDDADGMLSAFPYPLRHLRGTLKVREGAVEVENVAMQRGDASMLVNGRVTWPTEMSVADAGGVKPDLTVSGRNIAIDNDLLNALPSDKRDSVKKFGLSGKLDVDGRIFGSSNLNSSAAYGALADGLAYDLTLGLHDATAVPMGEAFAASDVSAQLHLTQDYLEVKGLKGRRGESEFFGSGRVDWSGQQPPRVTLNAGAKKLLLDEALYKLLPSAAREVWDAIHPKGQLDADLSYSGSELAAFGATTQPAAPLNGVTTPPIPSAYALTLRPRDLSVMPKTVPYRLDNCGGSVTVTPAGITLTDVSGKHGGATLNISGAGIVSDKRTSWDLKVAARDVPVDADLVRCIPAGIRQVTDGLQLQGKLSLELSKLNYRGGRAGAAAPDIDLAGRVSSASTSMQLSVPLEEVAGGLTFDAAVRAGQLRELHGQVAIDSLKIAERPVRQLKADLTKEAGADALHIRKIQGELAGGEFAGDVHLHFPEQRPSTFAMDIVLKNADIKTVAGFSKEIRGQMSASLALEGQWADASTRRGRGDVTVTGKQMYEIPLLLGLFEVTNLSLPSTSPFSEGAASYAVDGRRVTFDRIQMRSNTMVMNGNGWLDFSTKKVRMTFSTDNPNWPKLPFIHDLWQGAKQELMQIQVRGTVQDPKVSATSLHTFTTTVDEVFGGSGKEK